MVVAIITLKLLMVKIEPLKFIYTVVKIEPSNLKC